MHIISAHSPRKVSLFATRNGFLIETSLFRPLSERVLNWCSKINKKVFLWLDWPSPTIDWIAEARVDWWVKRGSEGRSPINDLNSEARVKAKGSGPMSMIRYTGLLIRALVKKPGRIYLGCRSAAWARFVKLYYWDVEAIPWELWLICSLLWCSDDSTPVAGKSWCAVICCLTAGNKRFAANLLYLLSKQVATECLICNSRIQISDLAIRFPGGILHQSAVITSDENT